MNAYDFDNERTVHEQQAVRSTFNEFLSRVFLLMFVGLAVTTGVAVFTSYSPTMLNLVLSLLSGTGYFMLLAAYILIAVFLGRAAMKMNSGMAMLLFLLYAVLTGFNFSILGLVFSTQSIWKAFLGAGVLFGGMALYGMVTKRNLENIATILMIGVIALLVMMVVNFFLKSEMLDYVLSAVGIIIFMLYTAYDIHKLKRLHAQAPDQALQSVGVMGAFQLYLDFINLFIFILRLTGRRRN